jgi:FUS-interacting serine-arginine-rich protein 1
MLMFSGDVRDVYLPLDFYTKLPRGFGFVEFTRDEDAEAALQALSRYATLDGAEISVTVAQQGRKSPDSMRRRERVNHHGDRRSHGHYDDYDSRHRKGRTDSRSRYHQRYYRSRSRSCDGYCHSHTRRYRPEDRLSYRDHHR